MIRRTLLMVLLAGTFAAEMLPLTSGAQLFDSELGRYASRMQTRARRDSVLRALRGGAFTPDHLRTAYRDTLARAMVAGARAGRLLQDSTLVGYDVHAYSKVAIGIKATSLGPERNFETHEIAARIRWHRNHGAMIDGQGARSTTGISFEKDSRMREARSRLAGGGMQLPYYPGREDLWLGGSTFGFNESDPVLLDPLGHEAEAYYTYSSGDSASIRLPDGKEIFLREIRIAPRRAHWTLIVGSFWFDISNHRLVRAAYRPSDKVNAWEYGKWIERDMYGEDEAGALALRATLSPFDATVSAITIDYGLYEGRFWLPRAQYATGEIRASLLRFPVEIVQKYDYESVNMALPAMDTAQLSRLALRDSLWMLDSLAYYGDSAAARRFAELRRIENARTVVAVQQRRDSLLVLRQRVAEDSMPREVVRMFGEGAIYRGCAARDDSTNSLVLGPRTGVRMLVRMPCNDSSLVNSSRLPPTPQSSHADILQTGGPGDLARRLGFGLQAGWGFTSSRWRFGLGDELMRYNRIEGLSPAVGITQGVGAGFTIDALARIGTADHVFNGEISLERSNGNQTLKLGAYRRLVPANDWGNPYSPGASFQAMLFGRDEGFYYRAHGAELVAATSGNPRIEWKLSAERHSTADARAAFSFAKVLGGAPFLPNITASHGDALTASLQLNHQVGMDPRRLRVFTTLRAEETAGDFGFARVMADLSLTREVAGIATLSFTVGAGTSSGDVPAQRQFILGGTHTVRGQRAGIAAGNAFWRSRLELGSSGTGVKPVLFGDIAWAGSRGDWSRPGTPLSGVGAGISVLDGMVRLDLARGINPAGRWRLVMYLDGRQ